MATWYVPMKLVPTMVRVSPPASPAVVLPPGLVVVLDVMVGALMGLVVAVAVKVPV